MNILKFILLTVIISTALLSCDEANPNDLQGQQDIVIVGGDTLGRNWDNLATKDEAEEARALGLTPEQYLQMKDEMQKQELDQRMREQNGDGGETGGDGTQEWSYEPTSFSDKMYQEQTQTVITQDGREVVVSSSKKYK